MEQLIHGIHHVALQYDGLEKFQEAIHFYHELLGLKILRTWGAGDKSAAMLDTGSGILELFAFCENKVRGTIDHIALAAKDVDLCINIVRMSGYEITKEPTTLNFPTAEPYSARLAFCVGPGGEKVEFFCEQ